MMRCEVATRIIYLNKCRFVSVQCFCNFFVNVVIYGIEVYTPVLVEVICIGDSCLRLHKGFFLLRG